jgi:glutamate transport system permease protein
MHVILDNRGAILDGFLETLRLAGLSAVCCAVVGLLLAVLRVGPVPPLRWVGTAYVAVLRNTPLTLVFLIVVHGLPELGLRGSFFQRAVIALSAYTAAFVCEAVRSGILTVPAGQAEAARALGMSFGQNLRLVILPQALRAVVPPLTSVLIALVKNTAIAEAFGLVEATGVLDDLTRDHASAALYVFAAIALGYMVITLAISAGARLIERRTAVAR